MDSKLILTLVPGHKPKVPFSTSAIIVECEEVSRLFVELVVICKVVRLTITRGKEVEGKDEELLWEVGDVLLPSGGLSDN